MSEVLHVVVPGGIDDPTRPSGGNTYDRRLCDALRERGWTVAVIEVEGGWPWAAERGAPGLEQALHALPDGALVLVDGLLASRLPTVMRPAGARLRVVLLVHLPAGVDDRSARLAEREVVRAADAVVTPSRWCRDWLVEEYDVPPTRVHVAEPGVDPAPPAPGSSAGARLLTVGTVSAVKGQDRLLAALAGLVDLGWTWTCVGSTTVDAAFAGRLLRAAAELGVEDRCELTGSLAGERLESSYAGADLLVVPSRTESYGLVVTEAAAHGLPVVAHDVGGVREALGDPAAGLLVDPDDPAALGAALRCWLTDEALRDDLRARARQRRSRLDGWSVTAARVGDVLGDVLGGVLGERAS